MRRPWELKCLHCGQQVQHTEKPFAYEEGVLHSGCRPLYRGALTMFRSSDE